MNFRREPHKASDSLRESSVIWMRQRAGAIAPATNICGLFFQAAASVYGKRAKGFWKGVLCLKKTVKINQNYLFRRMYRVGKSTVTPYCVVYTKKNRQQKNRLGITATKKIGNAVQRNRARRIIQEAYRLLEDEIPTGLDIVIVARKKAVYSKMQTVQKCLARVLRS